MNVFICWIALAIILFDATHHLFLGKVSPQMTQEELDNRARADGYCDWEQYLYYNITLELA